MNMRLTVLSFVLKQWHFGFVVLAISLAVYRKLLSDKTGFCPKPLTAPSASKIARSWSRLEALTSEMLHANGSKFTHETAELPSSNNKNRYIDILPFEHSRVKLAKRSPGESDYINANWIPTKEHNSWREFIATQAPLPETFADFWRMVWEQDLTVIVMLTRLIEGGRVKAHAYWPLQVGQVSSYGSVNVTLLRVESDAERQFCVRFFSVSDGQRTREVAQFHYVGWPDFGVPASAEDILAVAHHAQATARDLSRLMSKNGAARARIVVHCSAGVGRAGTFIATATLMNMFLAGDLDPSDAIEEKVLHVVLKMRQSRPAMVQREVQYAFIFDVIATYSTSRFAAGKLPYCPEIWRAREDVVP